ncbi:MAG: hypothetical protein KGL39_23960 [Patescibacteria group bacterium]|nr:hypothetical protein [Patescibacteria group bacterium]
MHSKQLLVALVVVLTVILMAVRHARKRRKTPAEPRQTVKTARLRERLRAVVEAGDEVGQSIDGLSEHERAVLTEQRAASLQDFVKRIGGPIDKMEQSFRQLSPTHENAVLAYRSLSDGDENMMLSAGVLIEAGRDVHRQLTDDTPQLGEVGDGLIEMGRAIRRIPPAVHRLGVALELE